MSAHQPARKATAEVACTGKGSYTFCEARRVAKLIRNADKGKVEPYHCNHCHGWHIGNVAGKFPDRRREIHGKKNDEEQAE